MSNPGTSFGGLGAKVVNAISGLSPFIGGAHAWLADPCGGPNGFAGAFPFIVERLQNGIFKGKIANPIVTTQIALSIPDKYPIATGAGAALAGYIGKEISEAVGVPILGAASRAIMKYGIAAALNSPVAAWFYLAVFNPHGGSASGAGVSHQTGGDRSYTYGATAKKPDTLWQSRGGAHFRDAPVAKPYVR